MLLRADLRIGRSNGLDGIRRRSVVEIVGGPANPADRRWRFALH
jgi:hypothetical protein